MTDYLEQYLQDATPVIDSDYRNLQRTMLREMIKLSAAVVAPAESQVESQYHTAKKVAEEKFGKAGEKIESRLQGHRDTARQQYQDRLEKIQTQYQSELNALEAETKTRRDNFISNAEALEQNAKKNCEYEVMLAETIADGTAIKTRKERHRVKATISAAKRGLETLREQGDMVLRQYRQPIPSYKEDIPPNDGQTDDPDATFRLQQKLADQYLDKLCSLRVPRLFIGAFPFVSTTLLCGVVVGSAWLLSRMNALNLPSFFVTGPVVLLVTLVVVLLLGRTLWKIARSQVATVYESFRQAIAAANLAIEQYLKLSMEQLDQRVEAAIEKRDGEIHKAKEQFNTTKTDIAQRTKTSLEEIEQDYRQALCRLDDRRADQRQQADQEYQNGQPELHSEYKGSLSDVERRYQQEITDCQNRYDSDRSLLEKRWQVGLSCIEALLNKTADLDSTLFIDWSDPSWRQWTPSNTFTSIVRFGHFRLEMSQLAESVVKHAKFEMDRTKPVVLPSLLAFPDRCSLFLQTRRHGREQAIETLRSVMVRLFTSLPPGRVHFTIIDPVGLGENFAGFMHAADHEESLVAGRIWTETAQIQQQLENLTGHMEKVIQKYLRNEFETIEEYNLQAGELAEPYRFLVIADFPANFNEEAAKRLRSIINSGARCGVYTLIAYDARRELPVGIDIEDLASNSAYLLYEEDRFVWQDEVFRQFPLTLDAPPAEELLTDIMHKVGKAGKDSARVEVPFEAIAPTDQNYWTQDSSKDLSVPIGRTGATRLQHLRLGHGVAQHMLIAGKTGSGKSTLLHVVITNLALWYSPDQVELYLIDFKKGVEFKTYVTHQLAHARAIAIESDREFGLSILQRIDAEMTRRGDLFRQAQVQDIASYRRATGTALPRTVLIVDEFQVFFSEDDKLGQDAAILLEQLVRQGRAFGIHVLLGSQTLGGTSGLARSTIGQMAVRIALQCSETDSQLILDDDNIAARLLSRPGEAIYNDNSGMVVGNSPFQTAWLPESHRDEYLRRIAALAADQPRPREPLIVFEGNVPAELKANRRLVACLEQPDWPSAAVTPHAWLGEPVAIKDPTAIVFRRQSGANLLIIGQRDVSALGVIGAAMISLAAQHNPQSAKFVILEGSPADSPWAGQLERVASILPHTHQIIEWRSVPEIIDELARQTQQRQQNDQLDGPALYLLIYGLQRYRVLRRDEDDFGFSTDQDSSPRPDKQLAELLREGPPVGVHTLIWADTLATVERTLDRQTIREFDNRVLFQMSAADSSNLIDSPVANQLGPQRALFYSEEQGMVEKFRPYAPVDAKWLEQVRDQLSRK